MNVHVEPGGYVEAASGLLLVYAMCAVAGPLISSTFMQHFGPDAMFGVTASVHLALAGFAFYRMRQRARTPDEEQEAFTDSLRSEEHTSALQSLVRISYAVFCL